VPKPQPAAADDDQEYEAYDELELAPTFQRLRKQSGKPQNTKDARKQQGKEWGRAIHKQRKAEGPRDKP
jgi:hypothetical protein